MRASQAGVMVKAVSEDMRKLCKTTTPYCCIFVHFCCTLVRHQLREKFLCDDLKLIEVGTSATKNPELVQLVGEFVSSFEFQR